MARHGKKLTAAFVHTVQQPGIYCDEHRLVLRVKPSGYKQWIQRLFIHGKRRGTGPGAGPARDARRSPGSRRGQPEAGPGRRRSHGVAASRRRGVPTFEQAAAQVMAMHRPSWRNAKHVTQWTATLRDYVNPRIGSKPVDRVTSADAMAVLLPIWNDKAATARRVRQRMGTVMKWAIAQGYRPDNPAGEALGAALPKQGGIQRHYQALPYAEVAGAIQAVRQSDARVAIKLAFEFLVLTGCRSGEVRRARWEEIDLAAGEWTIPAERMKQQREHRVPLSARAREILVEARENTVGSEWVFPSPTGRVLKDFALSGLLGELGIPAVPHGFRSSFRDWAAECTDAPHAVMEAALAHVVRNKVEAAYARSDLFERRRVLMEQWERYLNAERGHVVPMVQHR